MAQKFNVRLLSVIQLPSHLLLASIVPINGSNDHFFDTEIWKVGHTRCRDCQPQLTFCLSTQTPEKTAETAQTQVAPETTQVTHSFF